MRSLNHAFSHSCNSPMNGGRGKKMRLHYGPENLEKLLEDLFGDESALEDEDIVVLGRPVPFSLSPDCCGNNYTSY